jgi:hypothetical protein
MKRLSSGGLFSFKEKTKILDTTNWAKFKFGKLTHSACLYVTII